MCKMLYALSSFCLGERGLPGVNQKLSGKTVSEIAREVPDCVREKRLYDSCLVKLRDAVMLFCC